MIAPRRKTPRWITLTLLFAGAYNLIFATWMILAPEQSLRFNGFEIAGATTLFWQGTGMFVGLFGVGYTVAAWNPAQHWLLILLGLISKILAGIGAVSGYLGGTFPLTATLMSLPNDIGWWLPFGAILWQIIRTR